MRSKKLLRDIEIDPTLAGLVEIRRMARELLELRAAADEVVKAWPDKPEQLRDGIYKLAAIREQEVQSGS